MLARRLLVAIALCAGCVGELVPREPGSGGADAGTGGGADGAVGTARVYFDDNVAGLLTRARPLGPCSMCHQGTNIVDGPDFLGASASTHYTQLKADPRIVRPGDPDLSLLVVKGAHTGDAFPAEEAALIRAWIEMESPP
jgi:hypothetical protein